MCYCTLGRLVAAQAGWYLVPVDRTPISTMTSRKHPVGAMLVPCCAVLRRAVLCPALPSCRALPCRACLVRRRRPLSSAPRSTVSP